MADRLRIREEGDKLHQGIHRNLAQRKIIMQSAKQEAIEAISRLPDTADIEEIMYRLYVLENIRRGQADAAQGKTTPAEQVLRDVQAW